LVKLYTTMLYILISIVITGKRSAGSSTGSSFANINPFRDLYRRYIVATFSNFLFGVATYCCLKNTEVFFNTTNMLLIYSTLVEYIGVRQHLWC
jgi:hypothetical protein